MFLNASVSRAQDRNLQNSDIFQSFNGVKLSNELPIEITRVPIAWLASVRVYMYVYIVIICIIQHLILCISICANYAFSNFCTLSL